MDRSWSDYICICAFSQTNNRFDHHGRGWFRFLSIIKPKSVVLFKGPSARSRTKHQRTPTHIVYYIYVFAVNRNAFLTLPSWSQFNISLFQKPEYPACQALESRWIEPISLRYGWRHSFMVGYHYLLWISSESWSLTFFYRDKHDALFQLPLHC